MMNSENRLSFTAASQDRYHGTTVFHRPNTSQNLPHRNQSFGVTSDYNRQSFVSRSTSQNCSYGTTITNYQPQWGRDPRRMEQLKKSSAASTEGCITLDDDPIALFGAYYMQSDWYRAFLQRPPSMYTDLARKLFTDSKPVPETGEIIIPTKYKSIFDVHNSQSLIPRHPEGSSPTENREDAQQSSQMQGCSNGAIGKNRPKVPPQYSDDQMAVDASSVSFIEQKKEKESDTTNATFKIEEDQSSNPSVLLASKEIGEDVGRQENTFGELIKTEPFLQEEFGLQIKEEVPWW